MFGFPKKKTEAKKIPNNFIPVDALSYVIEELGLPQVLMEDRKEQIIELQLLNKEGRDKSAGANFVSIYDFISFISKYVIQYSDKASLEDAVAFFDMDNDGKINPPELESMLNAFGTTEQYMDEEKIKDFLSHPDLTGGKKKAQLETSRIAGHIWGAWRDIQ